VRGLFSRRLERIVFFLCKFCLLRLRNKREAYLHRRVVESALVFISELFTTNMDHEEYQRAGKIRFYSDDVGVSSKKINF
jgi:hypothetical protein